MDCASSTRSWIHLLVRRGDPCGRPWLTKTGDHKGRPYDGSRVLVGLRRSLAGDVSVRNAAGEEVAAIVTYKLTGYRLRPNMG